MSRVADRVRSAGTVAADAQGRSRFTSPLHDDRLAGTLGMLLGVGFLVCFVTGVLSHLIQDPPSWFTWITRPAGLYRVNQGLHVATGLALIPLLLAKLWVVYPKLFAWPPVRSAAHAFERLLLLPLIGAALLLLLTGLGNINIWRPWGFGFREGHYAAAWIAIGALMVHVAAKRTITWAIVRRRPIPTEPGSEAPPPAGRSRPSSDPAQLDRRAFLGGVLAASGLAVLFTVGQSYERLRHLALLAPRRPDAGPQGFPVNRTAASVGLEDVALEVFRLVVDGPGVSEPLELTYEELAALPQRTATLPIACVEGWSTSQTWTGVPVRDLIERAGGRGASSALVISMQESPRLKASELNHLQIDDLDTLLALRVNGEVLAPDHGYPVRLIGPNRPGVQQTKWVHRIEVVA